MPLFSPPRHTFSWRGFSNPVFSLVFRRPYVSPLSVASTAHAESILLESRSIHSSISFSRSIISCLHTAFLRFLRYVVVHIPLLQSQNLLTTHRTSRTSKTTARRILPTCTYLHAQPNPTLHLHHLTPLHRPPQPQQTNLHHRPRLLRALPPHHPPRLRPPSPLNQTSLLHQRPRPPRNPITPSKRRNGSGRSTQHRHSQRA